MYLCSAGGQGSQPDHQMLAGEPQIQAWLEEDLTDLHGITLLFCSPNHSQSVETTFVSGDLFEFVFPLTTAVIILVFGK